MKRFLTALGVAAFVATVIWVFFTVLNISIPEAQFHRAYYTIAGGLVGFFGHIFISISKAIVFGGLAVHIYLNKVFVGDEHEPLTINNGEEIIHYGWRPYWLVLFIGGTPKLKHGLALQNLLEACCNSLGKIFGDVRIYARLDPKQRIIILELDTTINLLSALTPVQHNTLITLIDSIPDILRALTQSHITIDEPIRKVAQNMLSRIARD